METVKNKWRRHPTTTETYISVVCSADTDGTVGAIRAMLDDTSDTALFNINLAGIRCNAMSLTMYCS